MNDIQAARDVKAVAGRYLTFHLGTARYAVPVRDVREVVRLCPITSVPLMPPHVRGVINLRGSVMAVLDLRAKFQMPAITYTDRACIIVFERRDLATAPTVIGAIVDGVNDVVVLAEQSIDVAPDFAGTVDADYLLGVATTDNSVLAMLNIKNILATDGSLTLPST